MPDFAYTARDLTGAKITGSVSAASEREVVNVLSGQALFPIEITPEQISAGRWRLFKGVSTGQLTLFYGQLASLLRSGVPLLRSITVLREQTSNQSFGQVLDDVYKRVEDGVTLAEALSQHPRIFREMAVSMIRAGGEGGFLEDALDRVAQFTEQEQDLKSRTMGALAYPVFLAAVGTIVVFGLVTFFVPKFAVMFDRLRERNELPVMTDWLLWFSETLRSWGWVGLILLFFTGMLVMPWLQSERGRWMRDLAKLRMPMAGGIFQNLAVARFCRVLGTLLNNGVPILKSLAISREAAANRVLSAAIEKASKNISSGQSLASPLARSGYFPKTVVEMITVAEESNSLETVLIEIADGLEKRTWRRMDLLVRLLEPVMLLILAGMVLLVVIALLMPVIKMSSTI